jgi:hypothetical protein
VQLKPSPLPFYAPRAQTDAREPSRGKHSFQIAALWHSHLVSIGSGQTDEMYKYGKKWFQTTHNYINVYNFVQHRMI